MIRRQLLDDLWHRDRCSRDIQDPTFQHIFELRAFDEYLHDYRVYVSFVSPEILVRKEERYASRQNTGNEDDDELTRTQ